MHLPTAEAFDPLWRFAGHRALGTIFLLDARVGLSAAGLAPIAEALSQPTGARTFHVVLLGEGEPSDAGGDDQIRVSATYHGGGGTLKGAVHREVVVRFDLAPGLHIY
ncbi:MAG: hypothetical protein AAFX79_13830, partial [Planctomycetota bacterium]